MVLLPNPGARVAEATDAVGVRIGELSRRVGVSTELLRAWERRYALLHPARSAKGYRLYTGQDELRVRAMQDQLARGLSAAEAARAARHVAPGDRPALLAPHTAGRRGAGSRGYDDAPAAAEPDVALRHSRVLQRALDGYDESEAQHVLDTMLRELSLTTVLRDIVMPYLAELGTRWERGTIDVAQEHFASNLIRGRLAGLALGWGQGVGPRAILACPEDELHDLPLMVFGVILNRCGWRVTFLGTNTPVIDLDSAARHLDPEIVVLAAATSGAFDASVEGLHSLAARVPLILAGAGATAAVVAATGARALVGDPVTEAQRLQVPRRVRVGSGTP